MIGGECPWALPLSFGWLAGLWHSGVMMRDQESSPGFIGLYDSGFGIDENFDSRIENV